MTKSNQHISFRVVFGAGIYFIGDPCYALKDSLYEKWVKNNNFANGNYKYFAAGSTKYGDGIYYDSLGGKYGVDSGAIGVVNMAYSDSKKFNVDLLNKLGKLIRIRKELVFEYNHETFMFSYTFDNKRFLTIETACFDNKEDLYINSEFRLCLNDTK